MCELREREEEKQTLMCRTGDYGERCKKDDERLFSKVFQSFLRSMHDLNSYLKYTNSLIQTLHENTLGLLSWLVDVSSG